MKLFLRVLKLGLYLSLLSAGLTYAAEPSSAITSQADDKQPEPKEQKQFKSELTEEQWQLRQFVTMEQCPLPSLSRPASTSSSVYLPTLTTTSERSSYHLLADSIIRGNPDQAEIQGNIRLKSNTLELGAGHMIINRQNGDFNADDRVLVETPSALIGATGVQGNAEKAQAVLQNTQFKIKQNGANGKADQISINPDGTLSFSELSFSTCPSGDNSWRFSASDLAIDPENGWGEANDVVLRIANVPVFYFPWLKFPIDDRRHSGILPPKIHKSDRNGWDIALPIYWNMATNFDATVTPRKMEQRGTQLGVEFRYLTEAHRGANEWQWMNDRSGDQTGQNHRWSYHWVHTTQLADFWQIHLDAAGVSDTQYFHDLGDHSNLAYQDQLKREASFGFYGSQLQSWIQWLQFQPLSLPTEPYRQLPQWHLNWQINQPSDRFEWRLYSQFSPFENPDLSQIQGDRTVLQTHFSYPFRNSWGHLTPTLRWHHAEYQQSLMGQSSSQTLSVPSFSIDSGLTFEKVSDVGTQLLEPRLFALYTQHKDHSGIGLFDTTESQFQFDDLFRWNRFRGYDRIGDEKSIALAITHRFIDAKTQRELWHWSIGQKVYFSDRKVQLLDGAEASTRNQSNLVSELAWYPLKNLSFRANLSFDTDRSETDHGSVSVFFEPSDNSVVNVSHRFNDELGRFSEQSDLGFKFPITDSWRVIGRWNQDWNSNHSIETLAGIEYESCCWSLRLVSRRYLNARLDLNGGIIPDPLNQYQSSIDFQFVFKGMGGAGQSNLTPFLEDSLAGNPYQ